MLLTTEKDYPRFEDSVGGKETLAICFIFGALAALAIGMRVTSRRIQKKSLELNDYAIFAALIFTVALIVVLAIAVLWAGEGQRRVDIAPEYQNRIFVVFAAGQPLWALSNTAVKISILDLYTKIFPNRRFRYICYVVMGLSVIYFASVFVETFAFCTPVQYNWDKSILGGRCANQEPAYLGAGISNLVIDVMVVTLPMPMLWKLKMPMAKKLGISAMFGIGAGICILTMIRIIHVKNIDLLDFSYTSNVVTQFSILEPTLGIVNACFPVMIPALKRVFASNKTKCPNQEPNHLQWQSLSKFSKLRGLQNPHELRDLEYTLTDFGPEDGTAREESMNSRAGIINVVVQNGRGDIHK